MPAIQAMSDIAPTVKYRSKPERHTHTREDEALFVISGELKASVGDELFTPGAGETLIAPRNISPSTP